MSLQRYARYKDSGVEWLGNIPEGWNVRRLKHVASLKGRLGWQGLRSDEYTEQGPYLVTSEHFKNDRVEWERCYHVSQDRYDLAPEIQLRDRDLLLMKDGAAMGKLAFIDKLPRPACLNSHLLLIRPLGQSFDNRFLYYILGSPAFKVYMSQERTGTTFFGISQESIGNFAFPVPSINEQRLILEFLEHETEKIDTLIEEQQRLIELLKEKRQAVIAHAVTKGLNPDAPMKDSGINSLGAIPAHWKLKRVKHVIQSIEQGWSPQCENRQADEAEWAILKVGCVNGGIFDPSENKALPSDLVADSSLSIQAGDVLISRANTRELVGSTASVSHSFPRHLLCDKLYRIRVGHRICSPDYLAKYFSSPHARSEIELAASGASSSMVNIGQSTILDLVLPLPPLKEQEQILGNIQAACIAIDTLQLKARQAISLLQERRTALISAAVTGKIDVRQAVAEVVA